MRNGKRSQAQRIIDYMEQNGSITVRDIVVKLRINAATARLSEIRRIRKLGFTWEEKNDAKYKRYFLLPEEPEQEENYDTEEDWYDRVGDYPRHEDR